MKHLFFIHSSITFYVSHAIADNLDLLPTDVVFLTNGYQNKYNDGKYAIIDVKDEVVKFTKLNIKKMFNIFNSVCQLDKIIDGIVRDSNYVAYVPQVSGTYYQSVITHNKCVSYNFIEEGVGSYNPKLFHRPPVRQPWFIRYPLYVVELLNNRLCFDHAFLAPYKRLKHVPTYYYLRNDSIFSYPKKSVLLELGNIDVMSDVPTDSHIFIVSPLLEYRLITEENFARTIDYLACSLKGKCSKLQVKYHPVQNENTKQIIRKMLAEQQIEYCEIDSSTPMEHLIAEGRHFTFYGYDSSVLFYASHSKYCDVYSIDRYTESIDVRYRTYASGMNKELIFKNIKQI